MSTYRRYVALGDSQTEGLGDGDETTGYRGWADRFAEHLDQAHPGLLYANLAVRGRLTTQVRDEQLEPALALRPDIVTVVAGVNDLMRRRSDPAAIAGCLEEMYAAFAATGATVVAVTFPDVTRVMPIARPLQPKLVATNDLIRQAAARQGAVLLDCFPHPFGTDPRMWSIDRLHASTLGHTRFAAGAAHALGLPGHDASWTLAIPAEPGSATSRAAAVRTELAWLRAYAGPWLGRRLRGRSSGDGRTAKRPALIPVVPA